MVGQSKTAMVVLAILVAACAGAAVGETTTTVPVEPPTTTTTTEAVAPVDICRSGAGFIWEPARTYVADCFLVPVSFVPIDAGWRTSRVDGDRFLVTLVEASRPVAEVAVLGYMSSSGLDVVTDSILGFEGLTVVSDQTDVTVGGWSGVLFDVESGLDPSPQATLTWPECYSRTLGTGLTVNGPGFVLLPGGLGETDEFGFAPCRTFRVWVVDVDSVVITLIAAADEEDVLYDSVPTIERLLDSMTFEAP